MERNRDFQTLLAVGVLVTTLSRLTLAQYGGGTGEPNNPYQIWTAEHMNAIGAEPNDWDKHFKLMADIDLGWYTGNEFNAIGYRRTWEDNSPFTGVFDGDGHVIRNFTYRAVEPCSAGLFGFVGGSNADIRNVGLIDPNVQMTAGYAAGALVGYFQYGVMTGCYVVDGTIFSEDVVGALVGINYCGSITDSYSTGTIVSGDAVGGLVGSNGGALTRCYSVTNVSSTGDAGGLVAGNGGRIVDCYADAVVNGGDMVGGLVGQHGSGRGGTAGMIANCYSTSRAAGGTYSGGLVGYGRATVIGSYWDIETSAQAESAGGAGKTTQQMRAAETFLGWGACKHDGAWTIDADRDYPRLSWEGKPGQPLGPLPLGDLLMGIGTTEDPFLICTAEELNMVGLFPCEWHRCFRLMADVDAFAYPGPAFNVIGVWDTPFTGVFDGNGHTISNLALSARDGADKALFVVVADPNAVIRDLRLIDGSVSVEETGRAAMLVANLSSGTVVNCHGVNNTVSGRSGVGGLVGESWQGIVANCSSTGAVAGTWYCGGLVGDNNGSITNCSAAAVVAGSSWAGGLAGSNDGMVAGCYAASTVTGESSGGLVGSNGDSASGGTIMNSYASGTVSGNYRFAGLVGDNGAGTIANCYSTAAVSGSSSVGGLVADRHERAFITGSFWDIEASGKTNSAGGTGKTTGEMQTAGTFLDAGWDFVGETENGSADIWWILEGQDYPRLWWEPHRYNGGSGEPNDPYQIAGAADLIVLGESPNDYDKFFILTADIDMDPNLPGRKVFDEAVIAPGHYACGGRSGCHFWETPFAGIFDGNGHTILHLTITGDVGCGGLIGGLAASGQVMNLDVVDVNITCPGPVGSIVGYSEGAVIDCHSSGRVSGRGDVGGLVGGNRGVVTQCGSTATASGDRGTGGLVGGNLYGTIAASYSSGTVTGRSRLGGLVGENLGIVTDCHNGGAVTGSGDEIGGIAGRSSGTMTQCYNTGAISGVSYVGGLAGNNSGTVTNCHNLGPVTGWGDDVGGLVGRNAEGTATQCYSAGTVSGIGVGDRVGGLVGMNYEGHVTHCYSIGTVTGQATVGGLLGQNQGTVTQCYSAAAVSGSGTAVGGLVGSRFSPLYGPVVESFWDTQASGQTASAGGTGKATAEMQTTGTFLEAGWDFVGETANGTEDIWWILEGQSYPRLWWERSNEVSQL